MTVQNDVHGQRKKRNKVMPVEEAVRLIKDGDTISTSGFFGSCFAEEVAIAIEKNYLSEGKPRDLTLFFPAGQGDYENRGGNHFGHEGLLKRAIGAHWGTMPKLYKLAVENKIEAYTFPQGPIVHMFRDIAAHKPRTITTVGLGTTVDPRNEAGKLNKVTKEDMIELIEFDGKEYLAYKTFPIDVAILRGTTADTDGNITMEKEALILEVLAMAMAAKNSNGTVIVQVQRLAERGTLKPKDVKIPGILVDAVVVAKPENHVQTFGTDYNPSYSGEVRVPMEAIPPIEMSERKIIARRAAFELRPGHVVNLGMGVPEGIASIANEERILDQLTLTAEPGIIGGVPAGNWDFGAGANTDAIIDQPAQFDFYQGGGLDIAFLGLAQADEQGNVNVSKFGPKLPGPGGFIDITQNSKLVVYLGAFTASGLEISVENGSLKILKEGKIKKFVKQVEQVTFSGKYAISKGQLVLYVTERCVFRLTEKGLLLVETAPGIDVKRDILKQMEFEPIIDGNVRVMDKRIFEECPMGLRAEFA
ncbi:MAG: acyl CoA:acetate/3-ketoacid CoA transferase [Planctomycetota bacterium]|nr:MAG: acyl CoA:acetate/3-ketoacid CoA transferase [Planctomycetota bacterium]